MPTLDATRAQVLQQEEAERSGQKAGMEVTDQLPAVFADRPALNGTSLPPSPLVMPR